MEKNQGYFDLQWSFCWLDRYKTIRISGALMKIICDLCPNHVEAAIVFLYPVTYPYSCVAQKNVGRFMFSSHFRYFYYLFILFYLLIWLFLIEMSFNTKNTWETFLYHIFFSLKNEYIMNRGD